MKTLNKILNKTWSWVKENPKKTILGVGLAGLIATTAIKDNVHFESVKIINPQENQYVWGIIPTTRIEGKEGKGNIYTFGLLYGRTNLEDNSKLDGSMNSYAGIFGRNDVGNNSEVKENISNKGIFVYNSKQGFGLFSKGIIQGDKK